MSHPSNDSWMEYLYNEAPARTRRQMEVHLAACPDCRSQLEKWKATLAALDSDGGRLKRTTSHRWKMPLQPALQWAAAIALALGLGFSWGTRGRLNPSELKSQLAVARNEWLREAELQRQDDVQRAARQISGVVRQENQQLLSEFARQISVARTEDRLEWARQLKSYDQERAMDYADLRRELTVLARQTGTGFRQAESQFNWLASGLPMPSVQTVSGTNFLTEPLH
jgi:Putative zinc-finger